MSRFKIISFKIGQKMIPLGGFQNKFFIAAIVQEITTNYSTTLEIGVATNYLND